MSLQLKRFNMRNIVFSINEAKGPVIVLIGKRDTGKSYLVRDLLYYHREIPIGTVMSGTEEGNGFYGTMVPRCFIHHEYNSQIVANVLKRQKTILKQNKMNEELGKHTEDPRAFVILDDCLYDDSWSRDKLMRLMFMNGRHWKLMLVITMQYPLGVPPVLRTNIDYVFILRENIVENRKRIWTSYAGMFPTFESFCQVMDQCTENYECLVIANNSKSNKITDQVFWYKADPHPDFRLGNQQYWNYSNNLPSEEDEEEYDPSKITKRGAGPRINVKKTKW